jgi:hypothetical protein
MATTAVHQHTVNYKLRREVQVIARPAFDLTGDSTAMRMPGAENLFSAPTGGTAIGANQKLRS